MVRLSLWRAVFLAGAEGANTSGMTMGEDGWLYLVDDRGPAPPGWTADTPILYRVPADSLTGGSCYVPPLEAIRFSAEGGGFAALAKAAHKRHKFDFEGVASVGLGRFQAVDERGRLILELDCLQGSVKLVADEKTLLQGQEDLAGAGVNRAFEGIAMIGDRLFLAHEMSPSLIMRYSLEGGIKPEGRILIEENFDITGLDSDGGWLYALGRMQSKVFKIDPASGRAVARADFSQYADSSAFRYRNKMDFFRNSEGLVVKGDFIFIVLDGNGQPILDDPEQRAPLLLIFNRPPGF
ncbi:MAG: esterase-like activity of phytase family protein [Gemmatimonadota bacterium]|nr:esterase-like activity of phytase family protein [Gemmatimonadota bacterium]